MKKIKMKIKIGRNDQCKDVFVVAYMTPVAGLILHTAVIWDTISDRIIIKRNNWCISQYPTGLRCFGSIPKKEDALWIVTKMLNGFNWVGFTAEDIMSVNDKNAISKLASEVNNYIAKLTK